MCNSDVKNQFNHNSKSRWKAAFQQYGENGHMSFSARHCDGADCVVTSRLQDPVCLYSP